MKKEEIENFEGFFENDNWKIKYRSSIKISNKQLRSLEEENKEYKRDYGAKQIQFSRMRKKSLGRGEVGCLSE